MRIALVADTFPPLRTSGAVQLRDLSREFARQGHELTVILPSDDIKEGWSLEQVDGIRILRLRAPKIKDITYIRRTVNEFLMPFFMSYYFYKSPMAKQCWDGVVWYAPSIFHGPFIRKLKRDNTCRSYLVIRDIFPEWAVDMALMSRKGLPYFFFNAVAKYQYSVANVIGVQTPGNLKYFKKWKNKSGRDIEVLQNWLADVPVSSCSIQISETILAGRKIFVYAGNMGVAQNVGILLDLAQRLQSREDIGFLFVGRGRDAEMLCNDAHSRGLNNVLFHDEIHPDEIPGLYSQCSVGLIALDVRHKSHNIPGKFLTYMQSGLPVLANINPGNDLAGIIRSEKIGRVCEDANLEALEFMAIDIIDNLDRNLGIKENCRKLYLKLFSPEIAVKKITTALNKNS